MESAEPSITTSSPRPQLYSVRGLTISSALFSCFAGGFLLYRNFRALDKPKEARKALLFGLIGCGVVLMLVLAIDVPPRLESLVRLIIEGLQVGAVYLYARRVFESDLREHQLNGGPWFSNWRAVGISIPLLLVPLAIFFLGTVLLPNAPGALPKDEFLWGVTYHDTPEMQVRGSISYDRLKSELLKYPWLQELGQPRRIENGQLGITVCNPRIDKFLTVEVIGTPERHEFRSSYGKVGDEEGYLMLNFGAIQDALPLYQSFFQHRTFELDSLFHRVGMAPRDYRMLYESQFKKK